MQFVYILQCADGTFYIGCCHDIEVRINQHLQGKVKSTRHKRPLKLVAFVALSSKQKAFALERYFKSGSGKALLKKRFL